MVKISHYEVYADRGDGWKLEGRFSADQRYEAINLSREKEQDNLKVKIIKETFDVQDNTYQETVEYVSGLSKASKKKSSSENVAALSVSEGSAAKGDDGAKSESGVASAILKLVLIIVLSLVLANVFVTLITPLVESFVDEQFHRSALFVVFFIVFLSLAVPLIMKKVPWYLFNYAGTGGKRVKDKKLYRRAENILHLYQLGDQYETSVAPAYPEAKAEHKRYIVSFLQDVLSRLNSQSMFQDSFSRLGVKLIVYGGCLELSKYNGLRLSEANSLLFEAFKILDGSDVDLEEFYDSKKTFKDNRMAIILTGIGAYVMAQVIDGQPISTELLAQGFERWENQANSLNFTPETEQETEESEPVKTCDCLVNIQCLLKFFDEAMPDLEEQKSQYWEDVHTIISNLLEKYKGKNVIERDGITSIEYENPADAILFAEEFLSDIGNYKDELNNDNLIFLSKCNIIEKNRDEDVNEEDYITDILEHTYNNEVLITEEVMNCMDQKKYGVEFLGDKRLGKSDKVVPLYKLVY